MANFMIFDTLDELSFNAAETFIELASEAVDRHGRFVLALSGGSTPRRMFELLAESKNMNRILWDRTFIFWGDDRAVPPDHEWSNYRMAREALLSRVSIPDANVYRILGERGAEQAALIMQGDLVRVFGEDPLPQFDLVLQGMGSDGHTASLFPGTEALDATGWVVPVINPPANPAVDRVTMTFPLLNNARTALFLVAGKDKKAVMDEILNDPTADERYPAARINAQATLWYLDKAAFKDSD